MPVLQPALHVAEMSPQFAGAAQMPLLMVATACRNRTDRHAWPIGYDVKTIVRRRLDS
jgi:hypothetical protein